MHRLCFPSLPAVLALTGLLSVHCAPDESAAPTSLTYHQDTKALVDRYCVSCHTAGGIAPFALTDYESVATHAAAITASVEAGTMPPWLPSDQGEPLRFSRALPKDLKASLIEWLKAGAPAGDAAKPARVVLPPLDMPAPPRRDLFLDPGVTYQPKANLTDDYRCFVIDPGTGSGMPEEKYVQASLVTPGNPAIVHHVILFEVPAGKRQAVLDKDQAEAGPGYTCFGGAGVGSAEMVTGWAPGGVNQRLESTDGIRLRKGSMLVMQVHYNLTRSPGAGDRTTIELELAQKPPQNRLYLAPLADPDRLFLKAGDPEAGQAIAVPIKLVLDYLKAPELTLVSLTPHMHTLGKSIALTLDGQPLIDLPRWDFHWQQGYGLVKPVVAKGNQLLVLECRYDNSMANQPIVDGQRRLPIDVTWGERTSDEMCLMFLGVRLPMAMPTM